MAQRMEELARQQSGFLQIESVRDGLGITVSYWKDLQSITAWKSQLDHLQAQELGKSHWYEWYRVDVCEVQRSYTFGSIES